MKVSQIKIKNYRLLKDFTIDLEDNLSLIIGKNNCGKTSFLSLLERFLATNENHFSFDDFNLDYQQDIKRHIDEDREVSKDIRFGIDLDLYIKYDNEDDLSNVSLLMLNLNPQDNTVILRFEYATDYEHFKILINNYDEYKKQYSKDVLIFLKKYHKDYFKIKIKAVEYDPQPNIIEIAPENKKKVLEIINFQRIKAKRDVNNEDGSNHKNDKTLSKASSKYYDTIISMRKDYKDRPHELDKELKEVEGHLIQTDTQLTQTYKTLFGKVLEKIEKFGGVTQKESKINIISILEGRNIVRENTSVVYQHDKDMPNGYFLPEDYNGLGYMNLINMIFEIEILFMSFQKSKTSDINLIFIEEPEAHTHPQMQHIFIENIKEHLEDNKQGLKNTQTILSTHSAHIVSKSKFSDIKYFCKEKNSIVSKNLKDLEDKYGKGEEEQRNFRFLKQYLTLNKAELFFADKAIFIEGDTERILLPAMMKKMDSEYKDKNIIPLLSQHISIVEVGNYSHIFKKFIEFLGIKVLIITDLDSVKKFKTGKLNQDGTEKFSYPKCIVAKGELSSNSSIKRFLKTNDLDQLKKFSKEDRTIMRDKVLISYQLEETIKGENYHARSFEDAFIHVNYKFIEDNKNLFKGLKNRTKFNKDKNPYELARDCISDDHKSAFALDILYFGGENFEKWQIPSYIKQGLLWLRQ